MSVAKFGSFVHEPNEVNLVAMDIQYVSSPRNVRLTKVCTAYLTGEAHGADHAALLARMDAIRAAYAHDYFDFRFELDDGTVAHQLTNSADCLSGVQVIRGPYWPKGDPAELVNCRTFSITLRAEYATAVDGVVQWYEKVNVRGTTGPHKEIIQTFAGPKEQITCLKTPQFITQSGFAVGFLAYVPVPPPYYPALEFQDVREGDLDSGRWLGLQPGYVKSTWTYRMWSPLPLTPLPQVG